MPGTSRVTGVVTGTDAFAAKFAVVGEANVGAEMLDVLGSATRVVTVQRNRAQGNPGLDIMALNLFRLVEGKIASMQTFPSDLYALDRFWGPPRLRIGARGHLPALAGAAVPTRGQLPYGTWTGGRDLPLSPNRNALLCRDPRD